MYAITTASYRAVASDMSLAPGETLVEELPHALLIAVRGEEMKAERSQRLRATDWTQMADAPLSADERLAWGVYRQALRDMPEDSDFPDCAWPEAPAA